MRLAEFRLRARRKMKKRIAMTRIMPAPAAMRPSGPVPVVAGGTALATAGGRVRTGVCGGTTAAFVGGVGAAIGGGETALVAESGTDGAGDGAGSTGTAGP